MQQVRRVETVKRLSDLTITRNRDGQIIVECNHCGVIWCVRSEADIQQLARLSVIDLHLEVHNAGPRRLPDA